MIITSLLAFYTICNTQHKPRAQVDRISKVGVRLVARKRVGGRKSAVEAGRRRRAEKRDVYT